MGKLSHGCDLLCELNSVCTENHIRLGQVQAVGAVQKAAVFYYDQQSRRYEMVHIDKNLEITSLLGNISIKDGKPFVHAHITLSDNDGNAFGGHLAEGTVVFACEFVITSCSGPDYIRGYDDQTGLHLWKI